MNPKLINIAGPLHSTFFSLAEDEVSIGRDLSNHLPINDTSVSRHHCLIRRSDDHFKIYDLDSHNGTFINNIPVKERQLAHGDRIKIGSTLFLFLNNANELLTGYSDVQLNDSTFDTRTALSLRLEDALFSMSCDLNALLRVSTAINSLRDPEALQIELLQSIFEVIPAQRGAIIFRDDGASDFKSLIGLNREADQPVRVSRTVIQQVLSSTEALLINDVPESDQVSSTESLVSSRVQSILCVPLTLFTNVLGVIYLDTSDAGSHFNHNHLQLLTAIANVAAGMIDNARHFEWLESENRRLRADNVIEHNMIGEGTRMSQVYNFISKVAPLDSTVLITGESGTGKELAARAIHQNSPRARAPFVAINCATLTEPLLESELFGHEKGAFTGAIAQKKGKLEIADGGTVFLDEVGEIASALQAKLLRGLQEREFERVGGVRPVRINVRLIAATNRDLEEMVERGTFRRDLYYRLNVISLPMPPLRERPEDIPILANYFVAKYSEKCNRRVSGVARETRAVLTKYHWPGNVREMENVIERAIALGSTEYIQPEDLPDALLESSSQATPNGAKLYDRLKEAKKQIILQALEESCWNYNQAALALGVHPNNLHRLLRAVNLKQGGKR
jgi:transcriptional regulator with GAF, ATPase, and Fis domain